jgi:lysophospholipase L1-like esterase
MHAQKFSFSVRLTAFILVALVTASFLEAGARLVLAFEEEIRRSRLLSYPFRRTLILDPYEMPSPDIGFHWVLRPGYRASARHLASEKDAAGSVISAPALAEQVASGNAEMELRINSTGFKGPEVDHGHSRFRILTLGDSTTFGLGSVGYPEALAERLNRDGATVEVINGGVEGYCPRNILYEIDRYKALKPELVTLYIGWNALFAEEIPEDWWERHLQVFRVAQKSLRAWRRMVVGQRQYAMQMYHRDLRPDRAAAAAFIASYRPSFMERIELIVDEFTAAGSRVVLVTLPGLFVLSEEPSSRALRIGHLPEFTANPFVLAAMSESYNEALRAFAARRRLPVIDLARWSEETLLPREDYFLDSVHLTKEGLNMIGDFMAKKLAASVGQGRGR